MLRDCQIILPSLARSYAQLNVFRSRHPTYFFNGSGRTSASGTVSSGRPASSEIPKGVRRLGLTSNEVKSVIVCNCASACDLVARHDWDPIRIDARLTAAVSMRPLVAIADGMPAFDNQFSNSRAPGKGRM